ncbi:MAG: hypothetical protein EOP36_01810 [Rubrivivax sp.]|nr:MAG: hypothetical protein EOP36_01810 [Rubrivivax sp.]
MTTITRLPEVRSLSQILPSGAEGGKEFSRIIDILIFYSKSSTGITTRLFSDKSGDYYGLDSFHEEYKGSKATVGYQYKYYPSPLSSDHRQEIEKSLQTAARGKNESKIKKWILVTPDDLSQSAQRKSGGDVSWFEKLKEKLNIDFEIEHWGHRKLQALFLQAPNLCLYYYPELVPEKITKRKSILEVRQAYDVNLSTAYSRIEFVGMSVYKPEATRGVEMSDIYIPLSALPYSNSSKSFNRINPIKFLSPGSRQVVLGDPGSGKSTLIRFLALIGKSQKLQAKYSANNDDRLPIVVILRKYADALKEDKNISIIEYISKTAIADYSLRGADQDFFEYYLESGNSSIFFDGIDELPGAEYKKTIRDRIAAFACTFPLVSILVTSRIVGYDRAFSLEEGAFKHYVLAPLTLEEMDQFVDDWYSVRLENQAERKTHVDDIKRILRNPEQISIRNLAENPLLLTIIALVHRIDAVLPDERVVLYQKCTETLLNTWHTWKFRNLDNVIGRGRIERTNRRRVEALAVSMQMQLGAASRKSRAVLSETEAIKLLVKHIRTQESVDDDDDAKDLAIEFLEFIKQRAGLLIEVGDSKYSFVHLTFQEYLTATALAVETEFGGVNNLWSKWNRFAADPKWHEVFRLLVANMKSGDSQEYIISKLIEINDFEWSVERVYLLGGLLIDGIKSSQHQAQKITESLIDTIKKPEQSRDCLRIISTLKIISSKYNSVWNQALISQWEKFPEDREIILLTAFAVGLDANQVNEIFPQKYLPCEVEKIEIYALLLGENKLNTPLTETTNKKIKLLRETIDLALISSVSLNKAGTQLRTALFLAPELIYERTLFNQSLMVILFSKGPFENHFQNLAEICNIFENGASPLQEIRNKALLNTKKANRRINRLKTSSDRSASLAKTLNEYNNIGASWIEDDFKNPIWRIRENLRKKNLISNDPDKNILDTDRDNESFHNSSNLLINCFDLKPKDLWAAALKTSFLSKYAQRSTNFSEAKLKALQLAFETGLPSEKELIEAAIFFLHDIWLYINEGYTTPHQSPLNDLANESKKFDHPAISIALALRSGAFGEKSAAIDLQKYLQSDNTEFMKIFVESYFLEATQLTSNLKINK